MVDEIPSECKHGYGEYKIRETHKYFDKHIDDLKRINNFLRLASCDGCKFFEMKGCCHVLHNPYGEQPEINEEDFQGYREYMAAVVHQRKKLIVRIDKEFEVRNEEYKEMKEKLRKYKKKSKTRKEKVIVRKEEKCVYRRWVYLQQAKFSSQFAKASLILMAENVKNLKFENGRNFCEECDKESKGIQEYEIVLTTITLDNDMNLVSRKKNSMRVDTGPTTEYHCKEDLLMKLKYALLQNATDSTEKAIDETEETAEDVKDNVDNVTDNEAAVESVDLSENAGDVCKDVPKTPKDIVENVNDEDDNEVAVESVDVSENAGDVCKDVPKTPKDIVENVTDEDDNEVAVESVDVTENAGDVCKDVSKEKVPNTIFTAGVTPAGVELARPTYAVLFGNLIEYFSKRVLPENLLAPGPEIKAVETAEDAKDNLTDDVDEIAVDSVGIKENNSDVCEDVTKTCEDVTKTCEDVTKTCEDLTNTCEEVTKTCEDVTKNCEDVTKNCEDVTKSCEEVTKTSEEVTKTSEEVTKTCEDATKTCEEVPKTSKDRAIVMVENIKASGKDTAAIISAAVNLVKNAAKPTYDIEDTISDTSENLNDAETILNSGKILVDAAEITNEESTATDTIDSGAETTSGYDSATSSVTVQSPCARDSCPKPGVFLCSLCRMVPYCGKECSKVCWPQHKEQCRKEARRRERRKQRKHAAEVD